MKTKKPVPPCPDRPIKFIPCDENKQTFNWQKTNKKKHFVDRGDIKI
jgi:Na+-translocating ferredoxin:NAD+ oxidoreductase RNF subunit RnfB